MTDQQSEAHKENRLPRGIYALALLMFLAGGALGLAALVLPILGTNSVPWLIYLLYGSYFIVVGYGLWGARRWAYFAALMMCAVLLYYQFQNAIVLRQNALVQVLLLVGVATYLLRPGVRAAFLSPAG